MTASQILKRQRSADSDAQLPHQPRTDGASQAADQQAQHAQGSLSAHCRRPGTTEDDILTQTGEQEACANSLMEGSDLFGPFDDSEQSCEDVLAGWGEAGEPDQEFAWAEPPAGMEDVHTEGGIAKSGTHHAAGINGHRTWACQVGSSSG